MPLFPDCTGSSWVCFAKNKSHRWFQKTCLVHYTSSRPKFSWFLEGLSPLFFKQNQTWVPPGMETACRNLSPFVPLLIPGPTRNQYSFDFSLPFSYFFLQIHCWLGWVVKIHMTPEYFLKRLVWFMNLSGKRSSMLIEAFFTLSLSFFVMLFGIFVKSQFPELCTRISALILRNTVSFYPRNYKKWCLYLQNKMSNNILYFWFLKSYCLEDKIIILEVTARILVIILNIQTL